MSVPYPDIDANDPEHVIPNDFKNEIIRKILLPYYKSNIEYQVTTKTGWSRVSVIFMTVSTVLITASSVMSFASSNFPEKNLNFIAGSIGFVSLVFKELASYANNLEHVKTMTINDMLKSIGVQHEMVDTSKNTRNALDKHKSEGSTAETDQNVRSHDEKMTIIEKHLYEVLLNQEKMKNQMNVKNNKKDNGSEDDIEFVPDEETGVVYEEEELSQVSG